ncbi:zinc finger CCCH domain-containing protein 6 [Anopheles maculipalpis]|uniref:zinc finger CCCH domain-containing protein 6 n=1 Tax=Anopheles maculipalpis TaxID=1496333 RepID=UPI002159277C|nr:zinc finger CCCH domain-containing protein 6 [Anopheles maculipalpis]
MFSLVADYGDSEESSSSDSSDASSNTEKPTNLPPKSNFKQQTYDLNHDQSVPPLPSARSMLQSGSSRIIPGSVFSNPFREAEEAKLASLEKHVKMVDPEAIAAEQKRKVCWSYKKGRCRFGSKCNFAHDSDLILRKELPTEAGSENEQESRSTATEPEAVTMVKKPFPPDRKKRPGLSRELVPPKKVLKMYHKEKYGMLK